MKNCPECNIEMEAVFNSNNSALEPRDDYHCGQCKTKYYTVGISQLRVLPRPRLKCEFCNEYCNYIHFWTNYEHWKCNDCKVEYQLRASTPPRKIINFYCKIKDQVYCFSVIEHESKAEIYTVTELEETDFSDHELVCKINQLPNITPQNVVSKLKTYVMFS